MSSAARSITSSLYSWFFKKGRTLRTALRVTPVTSTFTIGPAVAANKIPGVRAAAVEHEWSARDAVEHVNVNLITLGERVIGIEIAKAIVDAYLGAQVQGGRHERRRKQIEDLEKVKAKT